ncbi:MAG: tRNA (cytidine(34)-2'-O)-methyltransferase, partial [Cyanobacteriota bacterium]
RHLKRAVLDYWPVVLVLGPGFVPNCVAAAWEHGGWLLALSSHASQPYTQIRYQSEDWLLFGRESDGLDQALMEAADLRLTIPMLHSSRALAGGVRSLNLSVAVGVVVFEALRQTTGETVGQSL